MNDKDTDPQPQDPSGEPERVDAEGPLEIEETDSRRGRIDGPGLLDDFDEDADLTSDPEVEQVVRGIPLERPVRRPERKLRPPSEAVFGDDPDAEDGPLCRSSAWKVPAIIGGTVTLVASVFAGVYADQAVWAHVLLTLYWGVLHAGTGVGALVLTGVMLGRPVGSYEGAAARMLLSVGLFLAVFSLDVPLTSGKLEEIVLAGAAYFGGVMVSFRLPARETAVVGGAHFGVATLLWLGGLLSAATTVAGSATSGAAG